MSTPTTAQKGPQNEKKNHLADSSLYLHSGSFLYCSTNSAGFIPPEVPHKMRG
jgi:hypothetical protein